MAKRVIKKPKKAVKKEIPKTLPKQTELEKETEKDTDLISEQINRIENNEPLLNSSSNENNTEDTQTDNKQDNIISDNDNFDGNNDNNIDNSSDSNVPNDIPKNNVIDIFADLSKPTEQDEQQKSRLESVAHDMIADDYDEIDNNDSEDSEEIKKVNAKASAGIWVTVIDAIMMLGCLFLSKDFSDEAQRKFTLIPEKKTAIRQALYQVFMLRKKKTNPHIALASAIGGSYVPLLIIAVLKGRENAKKQREEKLRNIEMQNLQADAIINEAPIITPYVSETPTARPTRDNTDIASNFGGAGIRQPKKKGIGKGRHKRGCSYYDDKNTCNCKSPNFKRPKNPKG